MIGWAGLGWFGLVCYWGRKISEIWDGWGLVLRFEFWGWSGAGAEIREVEKGEGGVGEVLGSEEMDDC